MRDCLNDRGGFDRVLVVVAATFLTVSATSAMAQGDQSRSNAAELAIEAAIPRPEPANVPPPTINDFKLDSVTASVSAPPKSEPIKSEPAKPETVKAPETKPADVATAPAALPAPAVPEAPAASPAVPATASTTPAAPPTAPAAASTEPAPQPAAEPVKAASNVPPADQPVADKLKDILASKSLRYFERKAERAAVEKFYGAREYAPIWTQAGGLT